MVVRTLVLVVLCVSFTLAEQTIFTNDEISELFKTALNRYKKFSERGNIPAPGVPSTFTRHIIQGKLMKLDYVLHVIDTLKLYKVIVPDEFVVEQSQLADLKGVFQETAKEILLLVKEIEVTQPTGTRLRVSLKWPQSTPFNKLYEFDFSFPIISKYRKPAPNIVLSQLDIITVVTEAFNRFKEFTDFVNQLGNAKPYSLFNFQNVLKIQNNDLQLSYIIDDAEKIFTAEAHDKFLVKESDFSIIENALETPKSSMPDSGTIGVSPRLVNGHKFVYIHWKAPSNNYEFRLSFHVDSGHKSSLLLKLLAHLIH
ncbi:uncharacterized protein LOC135331084 [Halichondria panicea]|uniref:uncharacterized protein LOC135331084 n=1 Tax=Halichondria panicea TaxID=6063 RepID=UPI00312B605C